MMSTVNQLLKGCKRPDDLLGEAGRMEELNIRLMDRMLGAELTAHPGYGTVPEHRRNSPTAATEFLPRA